MAPMGRHKMEEAPSSERSPDEEKAAEDAVETETEAPAPNPERDAFNKRMGLDT